MYKRILIFLIFTIQFSFTQWFEIDVNGVNRTFLVSYPENPTEPCPLIINMHGYTSNAYSQQIYSQMDQYAHPQNIAVVYPQGLNNTSGITSWNIGTFWDENAYDDIGFLSALIDDINSNFNIDLDRVYACGMSNGGYMTYELACELSDKITAFGSVTGNFMLNNNQECDNNREIPIIHFHGTADGVVDYYPPSFDGALTVGESIQYWSEFNNLNAENFDIINDNVERYIYFNDNSLTTFVHIKVIGGGHEWFNNSWGIHASNELINFFLDYRLSDFININILGDINEDGLVNILDVIQSVNMILGLLPLNDFADLNEDGFVNIIDILLIVNIILSD